MSLCRSLTLALLLCSAGAALAGPQTQEAGEHFQRGVALYNETDYRAALVEFRRAYEIAPNATVLYNIGQTHYQLQNYSAALQTLERYLAEAPSDSPHRVEVEKTLGILRLRVGKIAITSNLPDAEVTIDDELVGKTPFAQPVLVSIGRRKITAMHQGRTPETRFVEVAAGDTVAMSLAFTAGVGGPALLTEPAAPPRNWARIGWTTTGVLAAGALTMGTLAFLASRDLSDARGTFPVTASDLDHKSSRVRTYSIIADSLGVATVIAGAISLKLTLSHGKSHEVHVAATPGGISLAGSFK